MNCIESVKILCPYCSGDNFTEVDCSEKEQRYVEDCQVCCRPMTLFINVNEQGEPLVTAKHENQVQPN